MLDEIPNPSHNDGEDGGDETIVVDKSQYRQDPSSVSAI